MRRAEPGRDAEPQAQRLEDRVRAHNNANINDVPANEPAPGSSGANLNT
jgi:hypothetical protein